MDKIGLSKAQGPGQGWRWYSRIKSPSCPSPFLPPPPTSCKYIYILFFLTLWATCSLTGSPKQCPKRWLLCAAPPRPHSPPVWTCSGAMHHRNSPKEVSDLGSEQTTVLLLWPCRHLAYWLGITSPGSAAMATYVESWPFSQASSPIKSCRNESWCYQMAPSPMPLMRTIAPFTPKSVCGTFLHHGSELFALGLEIKLISNVSRNFLFFFFYFLLLICINLACYSLAQTPVSSVFVEY